MRAEFGRALRPPYAALSTVAANGAFMSLAWFFLPTGLKDDTFTLHGSLAFALVLAAWMYSDVPATNVLAPDPQRVMAAIDDPVMLRRLLYAKNFVLWTFITPACAVIALATGISGHDLLSTLYTVIWIGVVPFGALGWPTRALTGRLARSDPIFWRSEGSRAVFGCLFHLGESGR
jgi:hypothetical protein